MDQSELEADLSAFADDEEEVMIGSDGTFIMFRNGAELTGRLLEDPAGNTVVERNGAIVPYRRFITHDLAGLPMLAERLIARRPPVDYFVDGGAAVHRPSGHSVADSSLAALRDECESMPTFAARVSFITADAGHGKTALLRQFQLEQARAFSEGRSGYLFWHVDLQGRQLLRLSEALMGDLGDLRISGLWMPAIVRLIRQRALVLAIDGFDELAAEQGGTDALGALSALVAQLGGRGAVVAAARRTFFDTDDYLRRAGVMGRAIDSSCEFNQLSLKPWTRTEGVDYLTKATAPVSGDPERTYDEIVSELGGDVNHPMLTRPFLLAQIVRALVVYGIQPSDFIHSADDSFSGVAAVVHAFVRREVADKWKSRDTGEAYLSEEQHMQLLADVAEEMYRSQKERLDVEVIETIASLMLDQWEIDVSRRPQILEMVRMHVLLVRPDGNERARSFDHPEFRDYFIGYALHSHIEKVMSGGSPASLTQFLSIAQISDSTALYVCGMLDRSDERVANFARSMEGALREDWRPTFLQQNVGTLVPFMFGDRPEGEALEFAGKAVYSSLVFERSRLRRVSISNGSFVNASLCGVEWSQVALDGCHLGELVVDENSRFSDVRFANCKIDGLRVRSGSEEFGEYAPARIASQLESMGIELDMQADLIGMLAEPDVDSEFVRVTRKFVRLFARATVVSDEQIKQRMRQDQHVVFSGVIPSLERAGLLKEKTWKGAGQHQAWNLNVRVDEILAAEGGVGRPALTSFWDEARSM